MASNVGNSDIGMAPKNACFPAILAVQALELAPRAVGLSNSYHTNQLRAIGDRCCFRRWMASLRRSLWSRSTDEFPLLCIAAGDFLFDASTRRHRPDGGHRRR